jgi:hypothetical protein
MAWVLAFALQAGLAVTVLAATPEWQEYTPPDGRFKVKMPAVPQELHGQWDAYISTSGATRFGVRVETIHPDVIGATAAEGYDALEKGEAKAVNGTVTSSRTVTTGDNNGREFVINGQCPSGPCLLTYRVFRRADRLFILTVYATPDGAATDEARTFLESFRITR